MGKTASVRLTHSKTLSGVRQAIDEGLSLSTSNGGPPPCPFSSDPSEPGSTWTAERSLARCGRNIRNGQR